MKKRILALILCCMLVLPLFAGCDKADLKLYADAPAYGLTPTHCMNSFTATYKGEDLDTSWEPTWYYSDGGKDSEYIEMDYDDVFSPEYAYKAEYHLRAPEGVSIEEVTVFAEDKEFVKLSPGQTCFWWYAEYEYGKGKLEYGVTVSPSDFCYGFRSKVTDIKMTIGGIEPEFEYEIQKFAGEDYVAMDPEEVYADGGVYKAHIEAVIPEGIKLNENSRVKMVGEATLYPWEVEKDKFIMDLVLDITSPTINLEIEIPPAGFVTTDEYPFKAFYLHSGDADVLKGCGVEWVHHDMGLVPITESTMLEAGETYQILCHVTLPEKYYNFEDFEAGGRMMDYNLMCDGGKVLAFHEEKGQVFTVGVVFEAEGSAEYLKDISISAPMPVRDLPGMQPTLESEDHVIGGRFEIYSDIDGKGEVIKSTDFDKTCDGFSVRYQLLSDGGYYFPAYNADKADALNVTLLNLSTNKSGNALARISRIEDTEAGAKEAYVIINFYPDHEYMQSAMEIPTCEKDGYSTTKCLYCGDKKVETLKAQGHNWKYISNTPTTTQCSKPATCIEDGYNFYKCTECGEHYTETVKAAGHKFIYTPEISGNVGTISGGIGLPNNQVVGSLIPYDIYTGFHIVTCANCDYRELETHKDYAGDSVCDRCGAPVVIN